MIFITKGNAYLGQTKRDHDVNKTRVEAIKTLPEAYKNMK